MPKINLAVELELPTMPNFLKVKGFKADSFDQAIASGDKYTIDVAELDDGALEQFIIEWAEGFRKHVGQRRKNHG